MPDLIPTALTELLLKQTGGVQVAHGTETTEGHLEDPPEELFPGPERGVITGRMSLVIARGSLTGITNVAGVDETVTTQELDATGTPTGSITSWVVTAVGPEDPDGGTLRLMLRNA